MGATNRIASERATKITSGGNKTKTGAKTTRGGGASARTRAVTGKPAKASKSSPPPADAGENAEVGEDGGARKTVQRGAAPWAARHAAKHAAEQKARAAEPPRPGSARATLRTPTDVEDIKAQVIELHRFVVRAQALQKNLASGFIELATILFEIQSRNLFTAKHYASFEAMIDRELNIGKSAGLHLARMAALLRPEAARELGLERALEVIVFVDGK